MERLTDGKLCAGKCLTLSEGGRGALTHSVCWLPRGKSTTVADFKASV